MPVKNQTEFDSEKGNIIIKLPNDSKEVKD